MLTPAELRQMNRDLAARYGYRALSYLAFCSSDEIETMAIGYARIAWRYALMVQA